MKIVRDVWFVLVRAIGLVLLLVGPGLILDAVTLRAQTASVVPADTPFSVTANHNGARASEYVAELGGASFVVPAANRQPNGDVTWQLPGVAAGTHQVTLYARGPGGDSQKTQVSFDAKDAPPDAITCTSLLVTTDAAGKVTAKCQ